MKTILAALCLVLMPLNAFAIERYTSTSMSCSRVRDTIARDGAAIMRYASTRMPGLTRYDRFVSSSGFCTRGETTNRVFIPAADTKSCPVNECKRIEYDDRSILMPGG